MTSTTKNSNPKRKIFLKSELEDFRIRRGFEQLSSSIGWRVTVLQSSAKKWRLRDSKGFVFLVIKTLKAGKAEGCDELRPVMLKDLNREEFFWLTHLSNGPVFWEGTEILANWRDHPQTHEGS